MRRDFAGKVSPRTMALSTIPTNQRDKPSGLVYSSGRPRGRQCGSSKRIAAQSGSACPLTATSVFIKTRYFFIDMHLTP
jgi:hypothetical protein